MHIIKILTNIQRSKDPGRAIEQHLQKRKSNVVKAIIKKPYFGIKKYFYKGVLVLNMQECLFYLI
jgi:hypothetical protein